jgi:hypothetical protein
MFDLILQLKIDSIPQYCSPVAFLQQWRSNNWLSAVLSSRYDLVQAPTRTARSRSYRIQVLKKLACAFKLRDRRAPQRLVVLFDPHVG